MRASRDRLFLSLPLALKMIKSAPSLRLILALNPLGPLDEAIRTVGLRFRARFAPREPAVCPSSLALAPGANLLTKNLAAEAFIIPAQIENA